MCERPGGYGENHRRVRRQEEIIWIRQQGFTRVVSLIPSTHNLHNYDEFEVDYLHRPFGSNEESVAVLGQLLPELRSMVDAGDRVLMHGEEVGDRISGLLAGFLIWSGMVPEPPRAVSIVERLVARQMGPSAREIATVAERLKEEESA